MIKKFLVLLVLAFTACELEDAPDFGREGDLVRFSGYDWVVTSEDVMTLPGPNLFSGLNEDVFLDGRGFLHMRIANHNGLWYSSEIEGLDTVGYGKYTFVVADDLENMTENVVLKLFSWNQESFQEEAYSEVDIQFTKSNIDSTTQTLHYSVQPENSGTMPYPERSHQANTQLGDLNGVTTHQFFWTDSLITFTSWKGEGTSGAEIANWSFNTSNPPRIKNEGAKSSDPIVIPGPAESTHVRINYWLIRDANVNIPPTPANGQIQEIVLRSFNYQAFD